MTVLAAGLDAAALLLDCDGTLVDSADQVETSWRTFADTYALDEGEVMALAHGSPTAEVITRLLGPAGAEVRAQELEAGQLEGAAATRPLPGAADLVAALEGTPWAVVTSGGKAICTARLRAAGLALPPVLVSADDHGPGKPAPDPYLRAAERLGLDARDCVVVEDTPAGVAAARAAGARVVATATTHDVDELAGAEIVVADLDDLEASPTEGGGVHLRVVVGRPAETLAVTVRELAAIAQTGLTFTRDFYDRDRYHRVRAVAARLGAGAMDTDEKTLRDRLDADLGYATPKVDVRALVRDADGRVLLVRERSDGRWTLPGGWADTTDLPSEAIAREVREEAGWRVRVTRLLACWDRVLQDGAEPLPHRVYKLFFACTPLAATAGDSRETDASGWFSSQELPPLSLGRVTPQQIADLVVLDADAQAPAAFH